jgi:hypothetical protein
MTEVTPTGAPDPAGVRRLVRVVDDSGTPRPDLEFYPEGKVTDYLTAAGVTVPKDGGVTLNGVDVRPDKQFVGDKHLTTDHAEGAGTELAVIVISRNGDNG